MLSIYQGLIAYNGTLDEKGEPYGLDLFAWENHRRLHDYLCQNFTSHTTYAPDTPQPFVKIMLTPAIVKDILATIGQGEDFSRGDLEGFCRAHSALVMDLQVFYMGG